MNLLPYYGDLKGSFGQVRLQFGQEVLDDLCGLLVSRFQNQLKKLCITPTGKNRFRIYAEMSNAMFQWVGHLFLNVLGESGIEIQIEQPTSLPGTPMQGTLATTLIGQGVVLKIVNTVNQGLEAGNVIQVNSELFGATLITLDPFPILQKYLPGDIGKHITRVSWETTNDSFLVEINWLHSG